eukprot:828529-Prorocentrum_lima.AAC.1
MCGVRDQPLPALGLRRAMHASRRGLAGTTLAAPSQLGAGSSQRVPLACACRGRIGGGRHP